jgi:alkanesulfonate monooxygenase SsuD/methylene tetrahydromethanopterin reductase-like flavin-dependent oxidoreductase (luciferase family)
MQDLRVGIAVFLGLGAGEAFDEQPLTGHFGGFQERFERLAEAAEIIHELWAGGWVTSERPRPV